MGLFTHQATGTAATVTGMKPEMKPEMKPTFELDALETRTTAMEEDFEDIQCQLADMIADMQKLWKDIREQVHDCHKALRLARISLSIAVGCTIGVILGLILGLL